MRFYGRWPFASAAALLLVCGCASGPSTGPIVSGSDHPEKGIEVELVADKPSPWGRTRAPAATEEVETEPQPAPAQSNNWLSGIFGKKTLDQKPVTRSKTGRSTRRNVARETPTEMDESTREYLERELRDGTPAERDTLYRELRNQDPQMARQIIKTWKMGRTLRQQEMQEASPADAEYAAEGTRGRSRGAPRGPRGPEGYATSGEPPVNRAKSRYANDDPWNQLDNMDDGGPAPRSNRLRDGNVSPAQYTDNRESYPPPPPAGARNRTGTARRTTRTADYAGSAAGTPNQYGAQGNDSPTGPTRSWSLAPGQGGGPQANTPYSVRSPDQQFRNNGAPRGLSSNGYPPPRAPLHTNSVRYAGEDGTYRTNPVQLSPNPEFNVEASGQYSQEQDPLLSGQGAGGNQQGDPRRNLGSLVPGEYQQGRNFLNPAQNSRGTSSTGFNRQTAAGMQNSNYEGALAAPSSTGEGQLPAWGQGNNLSSGSPALGAAPTGPFAPNQFSSGPAGNNPFANAQQNPNQFGFGQPGSSPPSAGQFNPVQRAAWQSNLQQVIAAAEVQTAGLKVGTTESERQAYIESHVHLRMLYLMSGQQERALQAIPGLDPADQEFWQQTFWGVSNYFDSRGIPRSTDRASQAVAQLTSAVQQLQAKANLELRNVTFCQKIASFGNYERFSREEFTPGQPVLLYAEVQNFRSEPTAAGQYRTVLKSVVEFYKPGAQAELLDRIEFNPTEDVCRNFRRDYFHSYEFAIPAKLSLGPHVMKLTVEDQLSHRVATYTLNFTVH